MRTTIDLPDNLYRRVKALAALRGKSLKTFITSALEKEVAAANALEVPKRRVSLPLVKSSKPGSRKISSDTIAEVLAKEDLDVSS